MQAQNSKHSKDVCRNTQAPCYMSKNIEKILFTLSVRCFFFWTQTRFSNALDKDCIKCKDNFKFHELSELLKTETIILLQTRLVRRLATNQFFIQNWAEEKWKLHFFLSKRSRNFSITFFGNVKRTSNVLKSILEWLLLASYWTALFSVWRQTP